MRLIDTHAHLDFPELSGDLPGVFERAKEKGVFHIITVGISLDTSKKALELSRTFANVSATAGIHPHGAHPLSEQEKSELKALLSDDAVVALGEIGLDYYRNYQPHDVQKLCFRQQLEIATEIKKTVVFHVRQAFDDFFNIVKPFFSRLHAGVVHCFSGDWEIARRCLDLGFYISIPGVVTFAKAAVLRDVLRKLPLDRILVETDAPFLAPEPYRGKPNEPSYVFYTAMEIARIKEIDPHELGEATTQNAIRAFKLEV